MFMFNCCGGDYGFLAFQTLENYSKSYITVQKFGVGKILFLMFVKEVSYAHQGFIYLIKNTVKTVIL